jgi:hypothetical protein
VDYEGVITRVGEGEGEGEGEGGERQAGVMDYEGVSTRVGEGEGGEGQAVVDYEGVITRVVCADSGVYELDHATRLLTRYAGLTRSLIEP